LYDAGLGDFEVLILDLVFYLPIIPNLFDLSGNCTVSYYPGPGF